jgi:deoxycytidylate deaminase
MNQGIDLSHIYNLRNKFTIIGLTGQIGSGCSEVAEQLERGFRYSDFEDPLEVGIDRTDPALPIRHNSYRKYRIVYKYAKENFKGYTRINYKDVLIIFLLQNSFNAFIEFLKSNELKNELETEVIIDDEGKELGAIVPIANFDDEINVLIELKNKFETLSEKYMLIENNLNGLYDFYFGSEFLLFCGEFHSKLRGNSRVKRNKLLQVISTNLRRSGSPYKFSEPTAANVFTIVELINRIIKSHRNYSKTTNENRTQIVIDDLRNPIEIMYFKQRFSAFYTIAINRDEGSSGIEGSKQFELYQKYKSPDSYDKAILLFKQEYNGAKSHEFYKANISACIQQADIHISFLKKEESIEKNKEIQAQNALKNKIIDSTSPYFSWKMQLLKYVSLISQPGLVAPSPEERCMQMAYTAKHNSGCISRHVGAAITDENYSIKAIGWNNTPAGQVPCALRNAEDLLDTKNDKISFTDYEKTNSSFFTALGDNFRNQIKENKEILKGRNVCFCFKDVKNSCSEGKNQVHTRSLHAEENAFLQLAKYPGGGIENGKLFTTASPCELCAKKAYQLGIKVIYYIDPYPGISDLHILSVGSNPIKPRLFNGAIGNAYHWLYDPIMPYKDEMTLLLGNKFKDFASKQKEKADKFEKENKEVKNENSLLKKQLVSIM